MPFFDSYKNIDRGGITKESKTATRDALLTAFANPQHKDHVLQIVKTLLDFKAHQSDDGSAERLLANLSNHVKVIGVPEITERSLHELVRNRSSLFKKELPDTFKGLLRTMLNSDAKRTLIDTNTARILKSNSLITDAEVRTATPTRRVSEQILPSEIAAFFTRCKDILPGGLSATWTLSQFLTQLCKDYPRSDPTETQWRSLAYVVRQVSNGRFGSRINSEFQRKATEFLANTPAALKKSVTSATYRPTRDVNVSMAGLYSNGGHDRSYNEFLHEANALLKVCQLNSLHEAVEQMQDRQRTFSSAPRLSQHLPGDLAWRSRKDQKIQWIGQSNPQHQEWLELRRAVDDDVSKNNQRTRESEDREIAYAILTCASLNQMVTRLINYRRGTAPLVGDESDLMSRLATILAPSLVNAEFAAGSARSLLCNFSPVSFREGTLPLAWNNTFPERCVTTGVNVAARILHQMHMLHIRIPGCHPVEDFHLYQTRVIQFSWDERANFITARIIDQSDWMCSTREPQPVEAAAR